MAIATRVALFLVSAAVALTAAADPLAITSITPATGPVTGGTVITITGTALTDDIPCEPGPLQDPPGCAELQVYVGGRRAMVLSSSPTSVTARTAAYVDGTFDVTVFRNDDGARVTTKNAFTYGSNWTRVLLPVYQTGDLHGANGSIWRTETGGYAATDANVTDTPETPCLSCTNHVSGPFSPSTLIRTDGHVPGRFAWFAASDPKRVTFNLRARDISREADSLGTEIRTPFEDDAYGPRDIFSIPNVPFGPLYRVKLRVYQMDAAEGKSVTVSLINPANGSTLQSIEVALTSEPASAFPAYPGYGEIDLPAPSAVDRADLLLKTPEEGLFWAFVSVTNNVTQQVTTVTPR